MRHQSETAPKQRHPPGDPMTLGNMRELGASATLFSMRRLGTMRVYARRWWDRTQQPKAVSDALTEKHQ